MAPRGRPPHPGDLTAREAEVVALVAKGHTNREIAERLGISEQGVKYHLNQVYSRHAFDSRDALIAWHRGRRGAGIVSGVAAFLGSKLGLAAAASSVVLAAAAAVVLLVPTGREGNMAASCTVDSALVAPGYAVRCLDSTAAVQALVPFGLRLPRGQPVLQQAAIVSLPDGDAAYIRLRLPDGTSLELLEGPVRIDFDRQPLSAGYSPLASYFGTATAPLGFFEHNALGTILRWCPLSDGGAYSSSGPTLCPGNFAIVATGLSETDLALAAGSLTSTAGAALAPPSPTPVPLPPFRGEHTDPVVDVPDMPGATEVDGFTRPDQRKDAGLADHHVQVYATASLPEEVIEWYRRELLAAGWHEYHGSASVAGREIDYTDAAETSWISVSTAYIARPEDAAIQPPPGFRGKGVPFADRWDGTTYFWIITRLGPP